MELQALIDRAGELQKRVADQADDSIIYCKLCCEQGRLCCVLETQDGERQRLIAIKDSIQDVHSMLIYIQSVRRWQLKNWNTAIDRLEESRSILLEKAFHYRGTEGRGVIEDLEKCFGYGAENPKKSNRRIGFFVHFIGIVLRPWKWHKLARFMLLSTAMVSAMSRSRIGGEADSRKGGKVNGVVVKFSGNVDVLHGRG